MRRPIELVLAATIGLALCWVVLSQLRTVEKDLPVAPLARSQEASIDPPPRTQNPPDSPPQEASSTQLAAPQAEGAPPFLETQAASRQPDEKTSPEEEMEAQCRKELRELRPLPFGDDQAMLETIQALRSLREMDDRATAAMRRVSGEPPLEKAPEVRCPTDRLLAMFEDVRRREQERILREGR